MVEPLFSIVIATYRRPALLAACLQALTRLDYARERFEVIVVDDGGGLREADVLEPVRGQLDVVFLQPPHGGIAAARNAGAERAKGAYLYFVDDDTQPAPDCLVRLRARIECHPGAAIIGANADAHPKNLWSAASQAQLDAVARYYNVPGQQVSVGAASHLAVPREAFREMGGFDPSLQYGEDRDFLDCWLRRGHDLVYAPEVVVRHNHPITLRSFWRRNVGYGRGAFCFAQRRRAAGGAAPPVDWRFYAHLVTYAFKNRRRCALGVSLAVLLARVAYTCGYLTAKRQDEPIKQSVGES